MPSLLMIATCCGFISFRPFIRIYKDKAVEPSTSMLRLCTLLALLCIEGEDWRMQRISGGLNYFINAVRAFNVMIHINKDN
jgi:hypothetical protein